jgi:hypothetical protein
VGPDARSLAHGALELIRRAGTFLDLQFVTAWKMDRERRMVDEVDQALVEGSPRDLLGGFARETDLLLWRRQRVFAERLRCFERRLRRGCVG